MSFKILKQSDNLLRWKICSYFYMTFGWNIFHPNFTCGLFGLCTCNTVVVNTAVVISDPPDRRLDPATGTGDLVRNTLFHVDSWKREIRLVFHQARQIHALQKKNKLLQKLYCQTFLQLFFQRFCLVLIPGAFKHCNFYRIGEKNINTGKIIVPVLFSSLSPPPLLSKFRTE